MKEIDRVKRQRQEDKISNKLAELAIAEHMIQDTFGFQPLGYLCLDSRYELFLPVYTYCYIFFCIVSSN